MDHHPVLRVADAMLATTSGAECFFVEGLNHRGGPPAGRGGRRQHPGRLASYRCCDDVKRHGRVSWSFQPARPLTLYPHSFTGLRRTPSPSRAVSSHPLREAAAVRCVQPASATLAPDCPCSCVSCRRRRRGHCRAGRCCRCRRPAGGGRDDALRFTTASTPCLRAGGARVGRADGAAGAACSTATRLAPTRQNNDDDEGGAHGDCPVPSFLLMPRGADR